MRKELVLLALAACLVASAGRGPGINSSPLVGPSVVTESAASPQGSICTLGPSTQLTTEDPRGKIRTQQGHYIWCCELDACYYDTSTNCAHNNGHGYATEALCLASCS